MSSSKIYNFTDPANYTYDSEKIAVEDGVAKLRLFPFPAQVFSDDFSSDVGFTYDSASVEFTGGRLQQKDLLDGASLAVDFTLSEDGTGGTGDLVGTLHNGASVSGGKLDLSGGLDKYLSYDSTGKINAAVGSIRFKYTPQYSGAPSSTTRLFMISNSEATAHNQLYLYHDTVGAIRVTSKEESGAALQTGYPFGSVLFTAGQEYDISYSWNFITGEHRVFIDGAQQGNTQTQTGVRSNDLVSVQHLSIGHALHSDALYDDLLVYPQVKFVSPPASPYVAPASRYKEAFILSPVETALGSSAGKLLSVDASVIVGSQLIRFAFLDANGVAYWFNLTSGQWEQSDRSYAESSEAADIIGNLASFPFIDGTTDFQYGVVFPSEILEQGFIDNLNVEYTHQAYPLDSPAISIATDSKLWLEDIFTFDASEEIQSGTGITYIMVVSGTKTYFDGAAWVPSNDTLAQSNTLLEVSENISTLISGRRKLLGFETKLTSSGELSPSLDFVALNYDAALPDPDSLPRLVDINGYIYDNDGPVEGLKIFIRPFKSGFNNLGSMAGGGVFHIYENRELATTLADGYFSGGVYLQPEGKFWEFKIGKQSYKAQLIDKDANDFNELLVSLVED